MSIFPFFIISVDSVNSFYPKYCSFFYIYRNCEFYPAAGRGAAHGPMEEKSECLERKIIRLL